jgi:hypothetical protein
MRTIRTPIRIQRTVRGIRMQLVDSYRDYLLSKPNIQFPRNRRIIF